MSVPKQPWTRAGLASLVGDEVAEKAHDISIALGVATMEATKKMFSFDILKKKTL